MDLRVGEHLQAVLEPAQIDVGRPQFARGLGRQQLRLPEAGQRGEQRGRLQALIAAAARELQRLHDEFDFADPARTELDVIGELAPLHFALDEGLHLPQALEHAVVEIAAIDERPYGRRVNFRVTLGTRDRAGLDVRVPLPVAPVARQVILEGGEARHQGTRVPERPQAQINAQHKALGCRRLQQPHQRLSQAREEFLVGSAARPVGLTMLGKQQHQIDVGGKIQLAAAELPHADDDEGLNLAGRRARFAVAGHECAAGVSQRRGDRRIGKSREIGERLGELRPAGEIPPGDAGELAPPPAAQLGLEKRLGCRRVRRRRGARRKVRRSEAPLQVAADEAGEALGIAHAGLRHEVAGGEYRLDRVANGGRRGAERRSRGLVGVERLERARDETGELRAERDPQIAPLAEG